MAATAGIWAGGAALEEENNLRGRDGEAGARQQACASLGFGRQC